MKKPLHVYNLHINANAIMRNLFYAGHYSIVVVVVFIALVHVTFNIAKLSQESGVDFFLRLLTLLFHLIVSITVVVLLCRVLGKKDSQTPESESAYPSPELTNEDIVTLNQPSVVMKKSGSQNHDSISGRTSSELSIKSQEKPFLSPPLVVLILGMIIAVVFFATLSAVSESRGTDWWGAVTLLTLVTFSILFAHFYNVKEFEEFKERVRSLESRMNDVRDLGYLWSFLTDVEGQYVSFASEGQEAMLCRLYVNGLISDRTFRRITTIIWKQGFIEIVIRLRYFAYSERPNDEWNRCFLASCIVDQPLDYVHRDKRFSKRQWYFNLLDITNTDRTHRQYAMAEALKGKFLSRNDQYESALPHYINAMRNEEDPWHYRGYMFSLLAIGSIGVLSDRHENFMTNDESKYNDISIKQEFFRYFITALLNAYRSKEFIDFYREFLPHRIVAIHLIGDFNRVPCYHMRTKILGSLNSDILRIYMTYYYYFGIYDKEADQVIAEAKRDNRLYEVIENVTLYWR